MARRRPATVHGVLVVDKPAGVTSHDVVGMVRRRFDERRVGHAGTLDPSATGVLVIGVGNATRLLRFVTDGAKSYAGEVVIGVETDSLDADGAITVEHPPLVPADVDVAVVRRLIAGHLTGDIEQVPPMVSALKQGGKRLHELAREGIEVERAPRPVHVARFDVDDLVGDADGRPVLRISVDCSAGTYIRSLAADLGRLLGSGAHLRNLRRTAVMPFTLADADTVDDAVLLPILDAVRSLQRVDVDADIAARIAVGGVLDAPDDSDGPWAYVHDGELLAVYQRFRGRTVKPDVVLTAS